MLGTVKELYSQINGLNSVVKNIIVIVLVLYSVGIDIYERRNVEYPKKDKEEVQVEPTQYRYSKMVNHLLSQKLESVLLKDQFASNILLLDYHDILLLEEPIEKYKYDSEPKAYIWSRFNYFESWQEVKMISSEGYVTIFNVDDYEYVLPKFVELIKESEMKVASFYPIVGINRYLGMVVILYKNDPTFKEGYFQKEIVPLTQIISSVMNYEL